MSETEGPTLAECPVCRGPAELEESSGHGDPCKNPYSYWRVRCFRECPHMETVWMRSAVHAARDWAANHPAPPPVGRRR